MSKTITEIGVENFHLKNGFPFREKLKDHKFSYSDLVLGQLVVGLERQCQQIKKIALATSIAGDERLWRSWLMIEELSETIDAMAKNDEELLGDALGDLDFVVTGTAVTYNIPMRFIATEVAASNMSKKKRTPENSRMRDKGLNYFKPDIKGAIKKGRLCL